MTYASLANDVLQAATAAWQAGVAIGSDRAIVVQGPDGAWKIRMYANARGTFSLHVSSPRGSLFHSVKGLRLHLLGPGGDRESESRPSSPIAPLQAQPPPVAKEPRQCLASSPSVEVLDEAERADPERARMAAVRLQTAFRARILRSRRRAHGALCDEMQRLGARLAAAEDRLAEGHAAFVECAAAETTLAAAAPGVVLLVKYPVVTVAISAVDAAVSNLLSAMIEPTGLDRLEVAAHASQVLREVGAKTIYAKVAKSITMVSHYPLIVGALPLPPPGVFEFRPAAGVCKRAFVRCAASISEEHAFLLQETFGNKWLAHCRGSAHSRAVCAFDVFSDRALSPREYKCSVLVSKHLVRVRGRLLPAVHIDSIASKVRRSGYGTLAIELCKALLFGDGADVRTGILFAQCLKIDFWEYRLHEDPRAQAMMLQMRKIYPGGYDLWSNCTMKMNEVENEDPNAPSPAKVLA